MKSVIPVLVICAIATSMSAQNVQQAKDFLLGIYSWDTNPDADDPLGDSKTYTVPLIKLMHEDERRAGKGNVGKLDFDPLCSCQDPSNIKYEILSLTKINEPSAQAHIRLIYPNQTSSLIDFDLKWTTQGWRIADIHTKTMRSFYEFLSKP